MRWSGIPMSLRSLPPLRSLYHLSHKYRIIKVIQLYFIYIYIYIYTHLQLAQYYKSTTKKKGYFVEANQGSKTNNPPLYNTNEKKFSGIFKGQEKIEHVSK